MIRGVIRGYALISCLGFAAGVAGCSVVIGEDGGSDPGDAVCIVDYDECLDLGVDEAICQAIYESCAGDEGGDTDGGGDDGGGCWDEVQQCLEENDGDEAQCQDVIEACQGDDDGGDAGDDGNTCWDEVEQCYEANPDSVECEALAQMCLGGDDDGMPDDGGDGEPPGCEEILEQCADDVGDIPDDCWQEYEQCVGVGDDGEPPCMDPGDPECCADGNCDCEQQYNECLDSGEDPGQCDEQYQWCVGMPTDEGGEDGDPSQICQELGNHCEQTQAAENNYCEPIWNNCDAGLPDDCFQEFFGCVGLEYGDVMSLWDVDEMTSFQCYENLANCLPF